MPHAASIPLPYSAWIKTLLHPAFLPNLPLRDPPLHCDRGDTYRHIPLSRLCRTTPSLSCSWTAYRQSNVELEQASHKARSLVHATFPAGFPVGAERDLSYCGTEDAVDMREEVALHGRDLQCARVVVVRCFNAGKRDSIRHAFSQQKRKARSGH